MEDLHYNITVKGRVQGVWFRKHTLDKALELRLTGFVKNNLNGDVYVEAEGDIQKLKLLIDWLYLGSPLSNVDEVTFETGIVQGFERFYIKR